MEIASLLQKLVLAATSLLGVSYVLINVPIIILLGHTFSQTPIESLENVRSIGGITLFLLASIALILLGCFIILGGLQYYRGGAHQGVFFLGSLVASFYLLCLGVGSLFLGSSLNVTIILAVIGPVLIMGAAAFYMGHLTYFKLVGSILGMAGGILLAIAVFNHQPLSLVFDFGVPFNGPFMSVSAVEAVVIVLGAVATFVYAVLANQKEVPIAHAFFSIVALVYGIGTFIGSEVLAYSFLTYLWKAPWEGPFHAVPYWFSGTIAFWSASLFLMMIGGIFLVACACIGFIFVAQEFAQL